MAGRGQLLEIVEENLESPDSLSCNLGTGGEYRREGHDALMQQLRRFSLTRRAELNTTSLAEEMEANAPDKIVKSSSAELDENVHETPQKTRGCKGTPVTLVCNHMRVLCDQNKGVYEYEVEFTPPIDSKKLRIKYLYEHSSELGGVHLFDGLTLYLPIRLPDSTTFTSGTLKMTVVFNRKLGLERIRLYNVLFDKVLETLKNVKFGRKQLDYTSPKIIPEHKLEIVPGYVTAVDVYEGGLMVCCDVSHRLLSQKTVLEKLTDICRSCPKNFQDMAKKCLLGTYVCTHFNKKTYRIDNICFDKNPMSTFKTQDGDDVSYNEYYLKNHNIDIRDKFQPLLLSINKQKRPNNAQSYCLVPEMCYLVGLSVEMCSDFRLLRDIDTFTRLQPDQRLQALKRFYTNVNNSPEAKQVLDDWGVELKSCEIVQGRLLDEEKIYMKDKSFSAGSNPNFFKVVTNNELLEVVHLHNWLILHCKEDTTTAQAFMNNVYRCSRAFGMKVRNPRIVVLHSDRIFEIEHALRDHIQKDTQIVVCILPKRREDLYIAIKKICCAEKPVPSQVIIARTLCNEARRWSIVQKIVLQMNCKLGGSLWSVRIPFRNVMICGIDLYHDPSKKRKSVAGFVASLNKTYSKWYSKAEPQENQGNTIYELGPLFMSALEAYQKENGKYPDSVIIYRQGVSDSQLPLCKAFEIPQFEQACLEMLKYPIKITFIAIENHTNTRLFTANKKRAENPLPGTVVDVTITRAKYNDFFLVSQTVRQGTVSPRHYIVLRNDNAYSPDILQRLTYKLCFMYYNWTGTISVPACCQYASKLAYLVGLNIKPSEELSTKLFYL